MPVSVMYHWGKIVNKGRHLCLINTDGKEELENDCGIVWFLDFLLYISFLYDFKYSALNEKMQTVINLICNSFFYIAQSATRLCG
jgi:hypothetical protein